jgi:hypothetical protein
MTLTQRHDVPSFVLSHGRPWFVNSRHSLAHASGYLLEASPHERFAGRMTMFGDRGQ